MKINFFEEYPTKENLSKLDLVTWPAVVLIATSSYEQFDKIRQEYKEKYQNITFGWWPTISKSYWISGISDPKDLDQLFSELTSKIHNQELPILLDLELPQKLWKYIKNLVHLKSNKKKINNFLIQASKYNIKVYTAEYPSTGKILYAIWKIFGLSSSFDLPHTKIRMCYSSMLKKFFGNQIWNIIMRFENNFSKTNQDRVSFGLGTIATGVFGNEPICRVEDIIEDIKWAEEAKATEIFIFRLGGMNEEYKKAFLHII